MFRPGEEPKRKQIPIRVVVIDSAGMNPPVDVAVLVGRNDLVSNLVQGIRTKLAIPVKEKIVLASVQFKHYDEKRQGKPGALFQGCSKVNVLYTCATDKDGKVLADANRVDAGKNPDPALPFDKRAVQGVIGFSREVPPDSPVNLDALARDYVENKSSNAKAAKLNDPVQPDDVLVAYRLPENTADIVIVYPCYHDDITKVKAEAQEAKKRKLETQKRVEKIKQARKEARRAVADPYDSEYDSDNPYYDSSDEDMEHDLNAFADEKKTWIKPFSFPLIMPVPKDGVRDVTNIPRENIFNPPKEIEVGGEVPAAALVSTLKNIISHCIKDGSDKPENAQAKGKRKAPVDSINLPEPLLLHTGQDYQNPIRQVECSAFEELYAGNKLSTFANLNYKHHHRKFDPKNTRFNYGVHAFNNSGFRMHQIIAVYNHGALSTSAKKAFTAPLDIFRAGAVRHQTAEEDEKDLPNLYRRQCAEHAAAARAERILLELKCASFACFDELPRPNYPRGSGLPNPPRKWRARQPLIRLAAFIKEKPSSKVNAAWQKATLEIKIYIKDPRVPAPAVDAMGHTCKDFVSRNNMNNNIFYECGNHREDYYSRPSYEKNNSTLQTIPGSIMYESISWMLWDADMMAHYDMICRMHRNVSDVRSIPTFMKRLEMPVGKAAKQPAGLTCDMRDYQLQSLQRMIDLEGKPGGLRDVMWKPIPALPTILFSPMFRMTMLNSEVPVMPKGGFICEEMGLGKTIEVLGLVLANPAPKDWLKNGDPEGTVCRSPSEGLGMRAETNSSGQAMDARLATKYRSTATLVVCAVSLVGQWIDEARSKLDGNNTLRIHMYHGQKRIRDPKKLAEDFDLIVTTYQTLASDRGKQNINHPLNQIEWYRIVLDEAHMAKSAATSQSKACFELRSARRWACTGTPMGTDVLDLHGQIKFLGLHPALNKPVFENWFRGPLHKSGRHHASRTAFLPLALLGSIMIRHTKNQQIAGRKILELPPKHEATVEVVLGPQERAKYDELHARAKENFQRNFAARGDAFISSKILSIMSLLLPLRRLCSGGHLTQEDLEVDLTRQRAAAAAAENRRRNAAAAAEAAQDVKPNLGGAGADVKPDPGVAAGGPAAPVLDAKPVVPAPLDGADKECNVCKDICDGPLRTGCGHFFCTDCLLDVTANTGLNANGDNRGGRGGRGGRGRGRGAGDGEGSNRCACPALGCRATIDVQHIREERRRTEEARAGRGGRGGRGATAPAPAADEAAEPMDVDGGAAGDGANGDVEEVRVVLNSESKLQALVTELRKMRDEDESNKALIFSQFNSTLSWLQERLPEEGFGFRTISGSMPLKQRDQAIQAFQKDPPTTVFLLSMRSGAVGINLTSATHVFLVEPAFNPALTEQAIGRSWRMGQRTEVRVKHLIVANSIESNIRKLLAAREETKPEDEAADEIEAEKQRGMTKGELAGHLKADKQKLKAAELNMLFELAEEGAPVPAVKPEGRNAAR